ncbi:glycosyltransferase [Enterococcus timonensis]|uniref:glycosyltransferase n=1 Tax=Enterococcus timonensis TaxID=1852364 RepID=UPI0008DAD1F2|nr:glycosyltransferase [Enterococcus timonensis]
MADLVSIIVPVYNVAQYLERCLDSIVKQSYLELEIIVVNDGSTDDSGMILEKYRVLDQRIIVLEKENGGLSSARNSGLDYMTGKYVTFVDSDDFIAINYVKNLVDVTKKYDCEVAVSQLQYWYDNSKESKEVPPRSDECLSVSDGIKEMLLQKKFDNSAWGKIYKAEFFNNIRYPVGKLYEDTPVTYKLFMKSNSIGIVYSKDYFYYQRTGSITNTKFNNKKLDILPFLDEMYIVIPKEYPELINATRSKIVSSLFGLLKQVPQSETEIRNDIKKRIIKYNSMGILKERARLKVKVASIVSLALGSTLWNQHNDN